jgi:hypothetical protein
MLVEKGRNGNQGVRDNIKGGGSRGKRAQSVEWTEAIAPGDHATSGNVLHIRRQKSQTP